MLLLYSCSLEEVINDSDNDNPVTGDCYLSEVTSSLNKSTKYFVENDKVISIESDQIKRNTNYIYDQDGKIIESSNGEVSYFFHYDADSQLIKIEGLKNNSPNYRHETFYDDEGRIHRSLATFFLPEGVEQYSEIEYDYINDNTIVSTIYEYNSVSSQKIKKEVITTTYDNRKNPYNTLNMPVLGPQENNPVETVFLNEPGNSTLITYSYNEAGYPITYQKRKTHEPDSLSVMGEFKYKCE